MTAQRSTIPVLSFRAGELWLAVAAEDVTAVAPARADVVHIAEILAVEASPPSDDQRVIHVRAALAQGGAIAVSAFRADPPVEVLSCGSGHIVPAAPGIPRERWRPVMGFAHIDERTLLLLDLASVVRALSHERTGGES